MSCRSNINVDITSVSPEVTGSCIKLVVHIGRDVTKKILLDKGFFQEPDYNYLNFDEDLDYSDIDYVLLSHNHIDHSGLLPTLYKHNYKGNVYCSTKTSKILPIALNDVAKIMDYEVKDMIRKKVLYNFADVENLQKHIIPVEFNKVIKLDENISVMFIQNPHLYGAASIFLAIKSKGEETLNLLYTGDYASDNMLFNILPFPNWLYKKKINIIQESTYGDTTTKDVKRVFKENILSACKANKAILLPAFAIGRYQEVMYLINLYKSENLIPTDYPVYIDGVTPLNYNRILFNDKDLKQDVKEILLKYPFIQVSNDPITRMKLLSNPKRCIVITTSGMISNGYSNEYARNWLNKKNVLIHLLGYMAQGTLGRELISAPYGKDIIIRGDKVAKLADVAFTTELSRHAKQNEQIEYLKPFSDIKCHFTTHGPKNTREVFSNCVTNEIHPKNGVVLEPNKTYKINAFGLKKIF